MKLPQANEVVGRYLSMLEEYPEMDQEVSQWLLAEYKVGEDKEEKEVKAIRSLLWEESERIDLPMPVQFFLKGIEQGFENLLKEEEDEEIELEIVEEISGGKDSIAQLVGVGKEISSKALKARGLKAISEQYVSSKREYSREHIVGAIKEQETSVPVWLRELVQNARNALRRLYLGIKEKLGKIKIRSYIKGGKWIVSVYDEVGMEL